jgi:hypothetical protein
MKTEGVAGEAVYIDFENKAKQSEKEFRDTIVALE